MCPVNFPRFADLLDQLHALEITPAQTYTGAYGMHKYWSKKPGNILRELLLQYSKPEDIVLDPFCGSGVTLLEGLRADRRVVGIDVNPAATFITRNLLSKVQPKVIDVQFAQLKRACAEKIHALYKVVVDGKNHIGTHFLWNETVLDEIWIRDGNRRKKIPDPNPSQQQCAGRFSYEDIPWFVPSAQFLENSRIGVKGDQRVHELFTPRNLYALALLYHEILQVSDQLLRELFQFCFTGALGQCSKMVFVIKNRKRGKRKNQKITAPGKKEVGSWAIGYWTPKHFFEINVWNCFENRYKRVLRGKTRVWEESWDPRPARDLLEFHAGKGNFLLQNGSCLKLLPQFPKNSIDYVVTDPPHGDRVPFLELSLMWNAWLGFEASYEDEIVVSNSPVRDKGEDAFHQMLDAAFREIYRVLKPGGFFTLIFNTLDAGTWDRLRASVAGAGFLFHDLASFGYSAGSVVQDSRRRGLKGDFLLTFKKPEPPS